MKKVVSGMPASAWGKATARTGPPDTTFFIPGRGPGPRPGRMSDQAGPVRPRMGPDAGRPPGGSLAHPYRRARDTGKSWAVRRHLEAAVDGEADLGTIEEIR
jgi:hypothetical protein